MLPMTPMMRPLSPHERLKELLREANYDGALDLVDEWDFRSVELGTPMGLPRLQLNCMVSDVLDYGGRYEDAARVIREHGQQSEKRVSGVKSIGDLGDDHSYEKQACWAVMMWGMCLYRGADHRPPDYPTAMKLFQLARRVLELIGSAGRKRCLGSLARAWYCIGLVERQEQHYRAARQAFRRSIECAGRGIREQGREKAPLSYEYNMARCYGLGIGWIAYNSARLHDGASALEIARHLMTAKRAKFISSYIDVVHSAIMVSESLDPERISEAIELLNTALVSFLPEDGFKHGSYALRAQNELALAHLRLATVGPSERREQELREAQRYVNQVTDSAKKYPREARTYWLAKITEARILRARGDYDGALKLTKAAREKSGAMDFIRIDACIGFGEAAMRTEPPRIRESIDAFEEALRVGGNSRKISAVCHLHLCEAYLADNKFSEAVEHFKLWEVIEPGMENAFIADLGTNVRKLLTHTFQPFTLSKEDVLRRRSATAHLNALRRWLAETAVALVGDEAGAARLLGLKVSDTVKLWLRPKDVDEEAPQ